MMSEGPLGVGVIGLGIGRQLAEAVVDNGGRIVALSDIDDERLSSGTMESPDARAFHDGLLLIEDPAVEAVIVATPDDAHALYVLRALELGKSVFCEKPLALSEEDLSRIWLTYRQVDPSVILTTNTLLRAAPRYRWLREAIRAGRLGSVLSAQTGYTYGRFHKVVDGWRGKIPDYSVVLGGGIHMIDLLSWVVEEWPIRVSAKGSKLGSSLYELDLTDAVEAILEFPSGLVASLSVSFASAFPHFHTLTIQGSRASFQNVPAGPALLMDSSGVIEEVPLPGHPATKGALVKEFLAACLGAGTSAVSARDTLYAAAVAISVNEAVRTGEPVEVARLFRVDPSQEPVEG